MRKGCSSEVKAGMLSVSGLGNCGAEGREKWTRT